MLLAAAFGDTVCRVDGDESSSESEDADGDAIGEAMKWSDDDKRIWNRFSGHLDLITHPTYSNVVSYTKLYALG